MTLITRSTGVTVETISAAHASQIPSSIPLKAGEALDPAAPCYIRASDGLVYMSNGTTGNEAAKVDGFTPKAYLAGQPVTLCGRGTIFEYGTGLTPGDSVGVARAVTARYIRVIRDS
jgi:hypothetical protein